MNSRCLQQLRVSSWGSAEKLEPVKPQQTPVELQQQTSRGSVKSRFKQGPLESGSLRAQNKLIKVRREWRIFRRLKPTKKKRYKILLLLLHVVSLWTRWARAAVSVWEHELYQQRTDGTSCDTPRPPVTCHLPDKNTPEIGNEIGNNALLQCSSLHVIIIKNIFTFKSGPCDVITELYIY